MWIHLLGLMLVGLPTRVVDAAAFECFSGVDDLQKKPCDKCEGLPIEVMLILDDSSSVRESFAKERDFALKFIQAVQDRFAKDATRLGAVFFSECMTGPDGWLITGPDPNGKWDCDTGSKYPNQTLVPLGSGHTLAQAVTSYKHGLHWGTPLSVGYDWALNEISNHGTAGQMRVVVMTSDGLPTRPRWPQAIPKSQRSVNNQLKKWEMVELCDSNVTEMKNQGIISLTLDVGGQDVQAERNMRRWASEPRDRWAVQGIVDFDALLARFDDILDRLCFYVDTVEPVTGDKNCIQRDQQLLITGKNLFDMGQDKQVPSPTKNTASNMYDLGKSYMITRIRIHGMFATLDAAKFQGSTDGSSWTDMGLQVSEESRYSCETRLDTNHAYCCIDTMSSDCDAWTPANCFCTNDPVAEWLAFIDISADYTQYRYIRLFKSNIPLPLSSIDTAEFFGKGVGEQIPKCRFTASVSGDILYSDATEVGPSTSYTEMTCMMPDTNGVYGDFTVEISRDGKDGTFTNNGRILRHADANCQVPEGDMLPTMPIAPTPPYFVPTPAPSSVSKLEITLFSYVLLCFISWI